MNSLEANIRDNKPKGELNAIRKSGEVKLPEIIARLTRITGNKLIT